MKYAILLLISCFSFAATLENDSRVLHGKLDNGMTYYIYQSSLKKTIFQLKMVVKTGSLYENDDEKGLAHFTEHMVFRGTKNFKDESTNEFQQQFGGKSQYYTNAFTSFNTTEYSLIHYAPNSIIVDRSLNLMNEMMFEASFDSDLLDKERNVVLSEGAMDDSRLENYRKARLRLVGLDWFANNFPIGLKSVVQNATSEKMRSFYKREYRPDKMALIIYSNMDANLILSKIENIFTKTFEGQPTELNPINLDKAQEPKALFYSDESCGVNDVIFERVTKSEHKRRYDQEALKTGFFSESFNSVLNAILAQQVIKSANYIGADIFSCNFTDEFRKDLIYVSLFKGKEKEGLECFYSDLYSTLAYLKSEKGVKELLARAYGDRCIDEENPDYLISSIVETLRDSYIYNIGYPSRSALNQARLEAQRRLAKQDVIDYVESFELSLKEYMNATVYSTYDTSLTQEDLVQIIQKPIINELDQSDESLEMIIKDSWYSHSYLNQFCDIGGEWTRYRDNIRRFICSNGLTVWVYPDPDATYTFCSLIANGGLDYISTDELPSYALIGDTLTNSGISNLESEGVRAYLTEKNLRMNLFCKNSYRGLHIHSFNTGTSYAELKDIFHLLNACFEKHKFKKEVFDFFIKGALEEDSHSANDEAAQFNEWLIRTLYSNNPYYNALIKTDPAEASFESAQRLCTKLFGNPRDFVLKIWTNASTSTVHDLIHDYLSPIMNKGPSLEKECDKTLEFASGEHTFYHTYEQGSWGYVFMPFCDEEESLGKIIEKSLAKVLLGYIIQERLHKLLRVDQGLSYTQESYFMTPIFNSNYSILKVSFTSQDEHIALMHECVKNLFIDIFANGVTYQELQEAKDYYGGYEKDAMQYIDDLIAELSASSALYISNVMQISGDAA
jgi:zinc protease